jgi:hypothetical protein
MPKNQAKKLKSGGWEMAKKHRIPPENDKVYDRQKINRSK